MKLCQLKNFLARVKENSAELKVLELLVTLGLSSLSMYQTIGNHCDVKVGIDRQAYIESLPVIAQSFGSQDWPGQVVSRFPAYLTVFNCRH